MIHLTEHAAEHVTALIAKDGRAGLRLRIWVKGGGCSGLTYQLDFDDQVQEHDSTFEQDGVPVVIDPKSQLYLDGSTLDFQGGLQGAGFVFKNPNAKSTCGCGTSFSA